MNISATVKFITAFKHQVDLRRCPMHRHDGLEIVYHAFGSGSGRLQSGEEIKFDSNSVVIYAPNIAHDQLNTVPGEDWCIILDTSTVSDLSCIQECLIIHRMVSPYLRQELSRLADTKVITNPNMQRTHDLRATALLIDLLSLAQQERLFGDDISTEGRIKLAHEYIRANFDLIKDLADVSNYVNLSLDYLRHLFRRTYGYSMKELLIQTRLDLAKHLLKHTPLCQKAIADRCGYKNVRYFNTAFKHYVGITPENYRKSNTDEGNAL